MSSIHFERIDIVCVNGASYLFEDGLLMFSEDRDQMILDLSDSTVSFVVSNVICYKIAK